MKHFVITLAFCIVLQLLPNFFQNKGSSILVHGNNIQWIKNAVLGKKNHFQKIDEKALALAKQTELENKIVVLQIEIDLLKQQLMKNKITTNSLRREKTMMKIKHEEEMKKLIEEHQQQLQLQKQNELELEKVLRKQILQELYQEFEKEKIALKEELERKLATEREQYKKELSQLKIEASSSAKSVVELKQQLKELDLKYKSEKTEHEKKEKQFVKVNALQYQLTL